MRVEIHDCRLIPAERPRGNYHLQIVTDGGELVTAQVTKQICEALKAKTNYTVIEDSKGSTNAAY